MRRFWTLAEARAADGGFAVTLDGRPVRTPARAGLIVPWKPMAEAIAAEWNECGDELDPGAMPLTGLANAAIDRIGPDRENYAAAIAAYGETDLLCYRAAGPDALVRWQAESWDALLHWARRRYDIDFSCQAGVLHVAQPGETVRKLGHAVTLLGPFELAGLSPLVTIGGSLVAALAIYEKMMPAEAGWDAVSLEDRWQLEQWGDDPDARFALDARRRDFLAAARFLGLCGS